MLVYSSAAQARQTVEQAELFPAPFSQKFSWLRISSLVLDRQQADGAQATEEEIPAQAPSPAAADTANTPDTMFSMQSPDQLFGFRGGNFHPSLMLRGEWTDNLYNINIDEQSSFVSIVSPGIWFGFPRLSDIPVTFIPYNGAVGGNRFLIDSGKNFERLQAFFFGGLDYRNYSTDADLNYTAWRMEGFFRYSLPAGLSFRVLDRYARDRDRFDLGSFQDRDFTPGQDTVQVSSPSLIRDYFTNMANAGLTYDVHDRYSLLFEYTNFLLDYDDRVNSWLNRTDHSFSLSISYHYSPKTTLFLEYNRSLIRYDRETGNDSEYSFYYGGIDWQGTAKSSLAAKGGYQVKQYENIDQDSDAFTMEALFNYKITDKTGISFSLYKALEETDSFTQRGMDTIAAGLSYKQSFSQRLRGSCDFNYELNDYQEFSRTVIPAPADNREDLTFTVRPAIEYIFRDWLTGKIAYSFENRDSTDNRFDYTTQTFFISINLAI